MENYVVSQQLLDERLLQRTVLRELHREPEIIDLLEGDITAGRKTGWDALLTYIDCIFDRIFWDL